MNILRPSKNHYYSSQQTEKQPYRHYPLSSGPITFKKASQNTKNTEQYNYTSLQKLHSSKNTIKRVNSLKNHDFTSFRSSQKELDIQKSPSQKGNLFSNKFRDAEHQKLTNKISVIEQKVQQMKNDLIRKNQQKEKIIKQQIQQREKWNRQRYQKVEIKPIQIQRKRLENPSAEERIKKISKGGFKSQKQNNRGQSILEPKQSSIIKDVVMQIPEPKIVHQLTQNPYSPRNNIYYVSEIVKTYKDDKSLAKQHIVQSLQIMRTLQNSRMPTSSEVERKKLNLVQKKQHLGKKTLIFDMDETLIHCNDSLAKKFDVKVGIKFNNGTVIEAGVNIRPYAKQILKNLHKQFQIVIFTASQACYADEVLNILDPNNEYIAHRLYREHCYLSSEGMYIKDLRIINRPLSHMILVDNAAYSYYFQLENGIPIIPYYQGSIDFELKELERYLLHMLLEKDIRRMNRETFKLHRYCEYYNTPNKLVEDLYINKV